MGAFIGTATESTVGTFLHMAESMLHIFGGPDPNNVPASQLEQAIEAAADNIQALYRAGLITNSQRLQGQQALLYQGQQAFQSIISRGGDVKPFANGLQNMTRVVSNVMAANQPQTATGQTLSVATAQQYYKSGPGWYPGSTLKAAQLTDAFVQDITSNPLTQLGGVVGAITDPIMSIFSGTVLNPSATTQAGVAGTGSAWIYALLAYVGYKIFKRR